MMLNMEHIIIGDVNVQFFQDFVACVCLQFNVIPCSARYFRPFGCVQYSCVNGIGVLSKMTGYLSGILCGGLNHAILVHGVMMNGRVG